MTARWRATAVRVDDPLKIIKAAGTHEGRGGHKNFEMTMGYVRAAEQVSADFGDIFAPLPTARLGAGESLPDGATREPSCAERWGRSETGGKRRRRNARPRM